MCAPVAGTVLQGTSVNAIDGHFVALHFISSVPLGCALQIDPLHFGPRPRIIIPSTYPHTLLTTLQPSLLCLNQESPNLRLLQATRAKECH